MRSHCAMIRSKPREVVESVHIQCGSPFRGILAHCNPLGWYGAVRIALRVHGAINGLRSLARYGVSNWHAILDEATIRRPFLCSSVRQQLLCKYFKNQTSPAPNIVQIIVWASGVPKSCTVCAWWVIYGGSVATARHLQLPTVLARESTGEKLPDFRVQFWHAPASAVRCPHQYLDSLNFLEEGALAELLLRGSRYLTEAGALRFSPVCTCSVNAVVL